MKKHFKHFIFIAFIVWVAVGCASAPSRFYTLNALAKSYGSPSVNCSVAVGPVSIPEEVDRPQFTLQVAPNRVAIDEFNRWAAPLGDSIARVIIGDLSVLLGTPRVTTASVANFAPVYQVTINIQKFESVPGKSVRIEATWLIHEPGGRVGSGMSLMTEPVTDSSFDALAAAHSRVLANISGTIADAIRSDVNAKQ
jgi:uncharacterized protein